MFEFHGWAVIRSTFMAIECSDENVKHVQLLSSILDNLQQEIASTEKPEFFHFLPNYNGLHSMTVNGLTNHYRQEIIDIFYWLAENAPGSYGLLYILNDEDPRGEKYAFNFRVFRLARGIVQEMADPFLSPPIPIVEAPYDIR